MGRCSGLRAQGQMGQKNNIGCGLVRITADYCGLVRNGAGIAGGGAAIYPRIGAEWRGGLLASGSGDGVEAVRQRRVGCRGAMLFRVGADVCDCFHNVPIWRLRAAGAVNAQPSIYVRNLERAFSRFFASFCQEYFCGEVGAGTG
jgi:hypothetical protein